MNDYLNTRQYVLADLKRGEKAIITGFNTDDIPAKFYSIGIVPGSALQVYRIIPFNGPICILLDNTEGKLAISRGEAKLINIEKTQ